MYNNHDNTSILIEGESIILESSYSANFSQINQSNNGGVGGGVFNNPNNYVDPISKEFSLLAIKLRKLELLKILKSPNYSGYYSIKLDLIELNNLDPHVVNELMRDPVTVLPLLEKGLILAQNELVMKGKLDETRFFTKYNCYLRFTSLFSGKGLNTSNIPNSDDVGKLMCIKGTIIRMGAVKLIERDKYFQCTKCKGIFSIPSDIDRYCQANKPQKCIANEERGCKGIQFEALPPTYNDQLPNRYFDYQELRLQESINNLPLGTIPRSITVIVTNDLVDSIKSGDDITLIGIVRRRWKFSPQNTKCDLELYVLANNYKIKFDKETFGIQISDYTKQEFKDHWSDHKNDPIGGRNEILRSFCPKVKGLYWVKLSVLLVLIGGVAHSDNEGHRVRGESHLLLVGDPGTGKSQFLKYAAKLIPRSVLTTGVGSSSSGLTVTAVKEGADWSLEAGALVLADRGICCIDEFNTIKESDRTSIYEAMEQQSISIAKAGIVCKLNSRCTVLAATNPKGKFDSSESLDINLALSTPLLSRFDLILILIDSDDSKWDDELASYVISQQLEMDASLSSISDLVPWNFEQLQRYILYVKHAFEPKMTPECELILTTYYQMQRQIDIRNASRITLRLLESLVRLTQAHAKLMFRNEMTADDAVIVVLLVEISLNGSGMNMGSNYDMRRPISVLKSDFPKDPKKDHYSKKCFVLRKLGLEHLIKEM